MNMACLMLAASMAMVRTDPISSGAQAEIAQLEDAWAAALRAKDEPALQRILAPEYKLVGVRSTGISDVPREEWLAAAKTMVFHRYEVKVVSVEVYGDAAIATVDGAWNIDWGPRHIAERFYLTDVWIKRDGRWQAVRRHSSPYAQEK